MAATMALVSGMQRQRQFAILCGTSVVQAEQLVKTNIELCERAISDFNGMPVPALFQTGTVGRVELHVVADQCDTDEDEGIPCGHDVWTYTGVIPELFYAGGASGVGGVAPVDALVIRVTAECYRRRAVVHRATSRQGVLLCSKVDTCTGVRHAGEPVENVGQFPCSWVSHALLCMLEKATYTLGAGITAEMDDEGRVMPASLSHAPRLPSRPDVVIV